MTPTACVNIHHYLLQVLLRKEPDWKELPCVVVTEDAPGGTVLDFNRKAREAGVRRGMRFAAVLSLVPRARAGVISPEELARTDRMVLDTLYDLSPAVESFAREQGVFWVGVAGMGRLYRSAASWKQACSDTLMQRGLRCRLAVAPTRWEAYLAAKADKTDTPLKDGDTEDSDTAGARWSAGMPLSVLALHTRDQERLQDLGVDTVGAFRELSPGSVRARLCDDTVFMHRFLHGAGEVPVPTVVRTTSPRYEKTFCDVLRDLAQVYLYLELIYQEIDREVVTDGQSIVHVRLELLCDDGTVWREEVRPAHPTRDCTFLLQLTRLRLESSGTPDGGNHTGHSTRRNGTRIGMTGITGCVVHVEATPTTVTQGALFEKQPVGSGEELAGAISLVRARYGNRSVGTFGLRDGYRPEDRWAWDTAVAEKGASADHVSGDGTPRRTLAETPGLVRRILVPPVPLRSMPVMRRSGPYVIAGGWWGPAYHREYYYLETPGGEILWVYHDRQDGTWMLQGFVE